MTETMTFDLTLGHIFTLGGTLGMAFLGALWTLIKIIGAQQETQLRQKFDLLTTAVTSVGMDLRREAEATRKLEIAFLQFQTTVAQDYMLRNDAIREMASIGMRIDNFALRMERALAQQPGGTL
jgi:hypothetical protein